VITVVDAVATAAAAAASTAINVVVVVVVTTAAAAAEDAGGTGAVEAEAEAQGETDGAARVKAVAEPLVAEAVPLDEAVEATVGLQVSGHAAKVEPGPGSVGQSNATERGHVVVRPMMVDRHFGAWGTCRRCRLRRRRRRRLRCGLSASAQPRTRSLVARRENVGGDEDVRATGSVRPQARGHLSAWDR
jgi:hypothetical protein